MKKQLQPGDVLRQGLLAWLVAAAVEMWLAPGELSGLSMLAEMKLGRLLPVAGALLPAIRVLSRSAAGERWALVLVVGLLGVTALLRSFTWPLLGAVVLGLLLMTVYGLRGYDDRPTPPPAETGGRRWAWATAGLAVLFFLFVSAWGVGRVESFSTPTYDFGIFSQMFHSMKETGLPVTTLERDGALSHFAVHVSPVYYLMLPVYWLFPDPATLQVLQAAVLASSVVPLWKLGRAHGLQAPVRMALCALLLVYPAFAGGTGYDLHENCFLTPGLLWLLWALDMEKPLAALLAGATVLLVKEDAAVYTAVVGLWETVRRLLKKQKPWLGVGLLGLSVGWFLLVTGYLARQGDGVMTYRYKNFFYETPGSLLTVVKAVVLCPMKAVYEAVDPEKLSFLALTMLPLLGLPLITRRYERWILLIPYVLVNLMSDYTYQHHIFFQYTFGSTALLLYLTAVNLADLPRKLPAVLCALAVSVGCFCGTVVPKAVSYPVRAVTGYARYESLRQALDAIPETASVTATTFYTTWLSGRAILYDLGYCSREHLLECTYVVFDPGADALEKYGGREVFVAFLERQGYCLQSRVGEALMIFERKP